MISYIKFLLTSTNQHGVHSPFVYDYLTKCLYKKPKRPGPKPNHVLWNSMAYFKVKNVWFSEHHESFLNMAKAAYPSVNFDKKPYDLIFFDASQARHTLSGLMRHIHNDTIVIVDAIYKNRANTIGWKKIRGLEQVRVSIDMYYCGALFFRKEQAVQHFTVRI